MDKISAEKRSENMRKIRSWDTKPELQVRRLVYRLGYRYRTRGYKLPGKPDMIFPGRKKVIMIHGCFWHQHDDLQCKYVHVPDSRKEYWLPKLNRNKERDKTTIQELHDLGWDTLIIWECQLENMDSIGNIVQEFL